MGPQLLIIILASIVFELQGVPVIHSDAFPPLSDMPKFPGHPSVLPAIPESAPQPALLEWPAISTELPNLYTVIRESPAASLQGRSSYAPVKPQSPSTKVHLIELPKEASVLPDSPSASLQGRSSFAPVKPESPLSKVDLMELPKEASVLSESPSAPIASGRRSILGTIPKSSAPPPALPERHSIWPAIPESPSAQIHPTELPKKVSVLPESLSAPIVSGRRLTLATISESSAPPPPAFPKRRLIWPAIPESSLTKVLPKQLPKKASALPESPSTPIVSGRRSIFGTISESSAPPDLPGGPSDWSIVPVSLLAQVLPLQLPDNASAIPESPLAQGFPKEPPGKRSILPPVRELLPAQIRPSNILRKFRIRPAGSKGPQKPVLPAQVPGQPTIPESTPAQVLLIKLPEYFQYYQELHTINQYNFYS